MNNVYDLSLQGKKVKVCCKDSKIQFKIAQWTTLSRSIYVIGTSVATTLAQKSIEKDENHNKSGHIVSCSYGKGEWVTFVNKYECQIRWCHMCSPSNELFSLGVFDLLIIF